MSQEVKDDPKLWSKYNTQQPIFNKLQQTSPSANIFYLILCGNKTNSLILKLHTTHKPLKPDRKWTLIF